MDDHPRVHNATKFVSIELLFCQFQENSLDDLSSKFIVEHNSKWERAVWKEAGIFKSEIEVQLESGDVIASMPMDIFVDVPIKPGVLAMGDNVLAPFDVDSEGHSIYHSTKVISEVGQWHYKALSGKGQQQ